MVFYHLNYNSFMLALPKARQYYVRKSSCYGFLGTEGGEGQARATHSTTFFYKPLTNYLYAENWDRTNIEILQGIHFNHLNYFGF